MLQRLKVRGFVLIDELELELGSGLNVLSGSSGGGKSLLLEALRFVLGQSAGGRKAAARWVRPGAEAAEVEAEFLLDPARSASLARALAQPAPAEGRWQLARRLSEAGRGRCALNGEPVSRDTLRAGASGLVELFGQGSAQALLEPTSQLDLLDAAAGSRALSERCAEEHEASSELARRHDALLRDERESRARWDDLQRERRALADLAPEEGEYAGLLERLVVLPERARPATALVVIDEELSGGEGEGLLERLHSACADLERLQAAWSELGGACEQLTTAADLVQQAAHEVAGVRAEESFDPRELEDVRARERAYRDLARRLDPPSSPDDLAQRWATLEELDPDLLAERRGTLARSLSERWDQLDALAGELSAARVEAASSLSAATGEELRRLGLSEARFEIELVRGEVTPRAEVWSPGSPASPALSAAFPEARGREQARFLFGANAGLALDELARASGGELGRVALALGVHATAGDAGLLVFDEIDQNVGARLGAAVGDCLARMGEDRQVLAITHLAPVAARAARHLRVRKSSGQSYAELLSDREARLEELALMIKGEPITPAAIAQAEELLSEAEGAGERAGRPRRKRARRARKRNQTSAA